MSRDERTHLIVGLNALNRCLGRLRRIKDDEMDDIVGALAEQRNRIEALERSDKWEIKV